MFDIHFILNIVIQVLCIFIFLTVFFFTYASKKEGDIVQNQVSFVVDNLVGNNLQVLSKEQKTFILNALNGINTNNPTNTQEDERIEKSNTKIMDSTALLLIYLILGVVGAVVVCVYFKRKNFQFFRNLQMNKILNETVIIVFFIGVTEFVFLKYFASRFISVEPNVLKAHIITNLKNGL
jgi:hypothetical protein